MNTTELINMNAALMEQLADERALCIENSVQHNAIIKSLHAELAALRNATRHYELDHSPYKQKVADQVDKMLDEMKSRPLAQWSAPAGANRDVINMPSTKGLSTSSFWDADKRAEFQTYNKDTQC